MKQNTFERMEEFVNQDNARLEILSRPDGSWDIYAELQLEDELLAHQEIYEELEHGLNTALDSIENPAESSVHRMVV